MPLQNSKYFARAKSIGSHTSVYHKIKSDHNSAHFHGGGAVSPTAARGYVKVETRLNASVPDTNRDGGKQVELRKSFNSEIA